MPVWPLTRRDTMNPDDEPLLSAYVDGELPEEQSSKVESTVRSFPDWAERCRDLRRVGEIVGSLSRPSTTRDQSPEILAEIYRRRSVFHWIGWFDRPLISKSMVLFASAAALVACATIGLAVATWVKNGRHAEFGGTVVARHPFTIDAEGSQPGANLDTAGDLSKLPTNPSDPKRDGAGATLASRTQVRGPSNPEVDQVRGLLASPTLKNRFVITDVVGGDAEGSVGRYFKETSRRNHAFARILLDRDSTVDPTHPGDATVFVVVLDAVELEALRMRVADQVRERLVESTIDTAISERLARVDSSFIEHGLQVASVTVPSETPRVGLLEQGSRDEPRITILGPGRRAETATDGQVSPEREVDRKSSLPEPIETETPKAAEPVVAPVRPPRSESSVVLVWVITRGRNAWPPLVK